MAEIVNKNPVNDPTQKPVKNHSTFKPNYSLYQSPTFGLNTPFFSMAGVGDDKVSLRLNADLDTYTLKAPSMAPVRVNTDYFMLPLRCLLPGAADLIVTNPLRGDDIDATLANATIPDVTGYTSFRTSFLGNLSSKWADMTQPSTPPSDDTSLGQWLGYCIRMLQIYSKVLSAAALPKQLGYAFRSYVYGTKLDANNVPEYFDMDQMWDVLTAYLKKYLDLQAGNKRAFTVKWLLPSINSSGTATITVATQKTYGVGVESYGYGSIDDLVYDAFYGDYLAGDCIVDFDTFKDGSNNWINPWADANTHYYSMQPYTVEKDLNILRILAYQKACAEFYTVDTIDDIWSAKLWEDNQKMLALSMWNGSIQRYRVNGVLIEYDAAAGIHVDKMFYSLNALLSWKKQSDVTGARAICWAYYQNLFGFTRSLRYQDYFVGARSNPLAVGDVTVAVNSNLVDVVDVTKKIQVQRFLNQVNRVGRKFKDYMKGVLGSAPMPDAHEPIFLGHVVDTVGAEETTNTGADQFTKVQSKTSNYRMNANRYAFTVSVPEFAILIGIRNFDVPRVYGSVTDREVYHIDRYEAFNPFMQFVGDQEVAAAEIVPGATGNFGYQMRYAEYKQRVSVAAGAFLGELPGYAKVLDRKYFANDGADLIPFVLSGDFIRARVNDIDEFYLNRAVTSPKSTFHFIIRNDMDITAHRPMAFAPSIL